MKRRFVREIMASGPRAYPIFRVTDESSWLVRERRARVGEEFIFTSSEPYLAVGPLVPGTVTLSANPMRLDPGDLGCWEFMEYRVMYAGQEIAFLAYQGKTLPKSKRRR